MLLYTYFAFCFYFIKLFFEISKHEIRIKGQGAMTQVPKVVGSNIDWHIGSALATQLFQKQTNI